MNGRPAARLLVALMFILVLAGCGSSQGPASPHNAEGTPSTGGSPTTKGTKSTRGTQSTGASPSPAAAAVAPAAAPVRAFLAAITKISVDRVAPPAPTAAVSRCLNLDSAAGQRACLVTLATKTAPTSPPLAYSAQACGALASSAQAALAQPTGLGNIVGAELETGGGGYPPSCMDLFRILLINGSGGPMAAASGVMDYKLAISGRHLGTLKLTVLSQSGNTALVRVADSRKTVRVARVHGVWKIAVLNYSDLP
jgi:hypothetical protein